MVPKENYGLQMRVCPPEGGEAADSRKFTVVSEEGREKLVVGAPCLAAVQPGWNAHRRDEKGAEVIDYKMVVRRPSRGMNSSRTAPSLIEGGPSRLNVRRIHATSIWPILFCSEEKSGRNSTGHLPYSCRTTLRRELFSFLTIRQPMRPTLLPLTTLSLSLG